MCSRKVDLQIKSPCFSPLKTSMRGLQLHCLPLLPHGSHLQPTKALGHHRAHCRYCLPHSSITTMDQVVLASQQLLRHSRVVPGAPVPEHCCCLKVNASTECRKCWPTNETCRAQLVSQLISSRISKGDSHSRHSSPLVSPSQDGNT